MIRLPLAAALLVAALCLALPGCTVPVPDVEPSAAAVVASSSAPAASPAIPAPAASPAQPTTSHDPDAVLSAWAEAVEARDWAAVRAFWGDRGVRSGLSEDAFAAQWSHLQAPKVHVEKGQSEGAAGSIYYTAPVTITDGMRLLTGEITIRRVNDIEGATPEQLRWHIETTTLNP